MKLGLMLFLSVILFLSVMSFSGCSTALTEQGQAVRMMKQDPPAECQLIKVVKGKKTSIESSSNSVRNECGEAGGNYLRLDSIWTDTKGNNVRYFGTCFKCPN
jgi:hypothetical protein